MSQHLPLLTLSKTEIARLSSTKELIESMESAFIHLAQGDVVQPRRHVFSPKASGEALGFMPVQSTDLSLLACKVAAVFPKNPLVGKDAHQGVVILFNSDTGVPLCFLEAGEITSRRTAAVSAMATDHLSLQDSKILAIIGAGTQAEFHVEALLQVRKFKKIHIYNRTKSKAVSLSSQITRRFKISVEIFESPTDAVADADVICTLTSAANPILKCSDFKPGAHVNAVGACRPGQREIEIKQSAKTRYIVDDPSSLETDAEEFRDITNVEFLGNLLNKSLKRDPLTTTIFKSVGLGLEDGIAARFYYGKARSLGVGQELQFGEERSQPVKSNSKGYKWLSYSLL